MQILFISDWFPYPPNNGAKLRIYNLLRGLAAYHDVTLLSFADGSVAEDSVGELQSLCQKIQVIPWKSFEPQSLRARLGFLSLTPRYLVDTFSPEMKQSIEQSLSRNEYDLIIASQLNAARYSPFFRGTRTVFEEVELSLFYEAYARADSVRSRFRHGLTWTKQRLYIARLLQYFDTCTVVSEQERKLLNRVAPAFEAVRVIPNCVNLADYQNIELEVYAQPTLIFTGSFRYSANYDAMIWFLKDVFPLVQAQVPGVRLIITGDHADLPLPNEDNVILTGFVEDVRPLVASSSISLAPLRVGGGTRLKILEAMALRTPVVATSKGAEGLNVESEKHLLIADNPEAFAEAILRVIREPGLSERLAERAYQLIRKEYDWAAVMPQFLELVDKVAFN